MTQIPTTDTPPQPIKWFKDGTFPLQQQVEWSKEEIDHLALLAQADLVFLIAQIFAPPSAEMRKMLEIEIPDIKELLDKSGLPEQDKDNLAEIYQQIRQQAQSLNLDTWAAEYNHLFEGNVACPINESGFIRRDKGVIIADIAGFYRAFGFELSKNASEKADHITGELEFIAMLLVMLAQAQDQEAKRTTHDALGSFSFDHLGEWLPTFCERLTETTALPIYQHLAQLLLGAWTGILSLNKLPMPDGDIQNLPEDDGTPYECGMAGD